MIKTILKKNDYYPIKRIIYILILAAVFFICYTVSASSDPKIKEGNRYSYKPLIDTPTNCDSCCDIERSVKVFKDVLYVRSTVVGLNGSNACFSLKTANIPKAFTTWIQKGRNRPFQDVYWYASDKQENLQNFSIVVVQSKSEPGNVIITVVPRPRYAPGTEVRITLIGVEAGNK